MTEEQRDAAALAELEEAARFAAQPRTQAEVAERLGLSRQKAQRIEVLALIKLRRGLEAAGWDRDTFVEWLALVSCSESEGREGRARCVSCGEPLGENTAGDECAQCTSAKKRRP
jgi:hypothetical protein